jgi:hypothetical protein
MKNKKINVELLSVDPLGCVLQSEKLSMKIENEDSTVKTRLVIIIGECLYNLDNKGLIIDRLVPHEISHPIDDANHMMK